MGHGQVNCDELEDLIAEDLLRHQALVGIAPRAHGGSHIPKRGILTCSTSLGSMDQTQTEEEEEELYHTNLRRGSLDQHLNSEIEDDWSEDVSMVSIHQLVSVDTGRKRMKSEEKYAYLKCTGIRLEVSGLGSRNNIGNDIYLGFSLDTL